MDAAMTYYEYKCSLCAKRTRSRWQDWPGARFAGIAHAKECLHAREAPKTTIEVLRFVAKREKSVVRSEEVLA